MQLGLYSFGDVGTHPDTGAHLSPQQRLRDLLEEIRVADEAGLDVFGVGEHHRPDYAVSAPATVLAAAAVQTKQIRLTSAVTVLSSDDPVRVFQQFATVDLLSNGRTELMAGRGSFIESFPLFGYDLDLYDALFSEKLDLLLEIRKQTMVSWKGTHAQTIRERGVWPRPVQRPLPVWIAVGGTPESIVRAGEYGLPLALAIIGGQPAQFAPHIRLYKEVYEKSGHDTAQLQVGINSHCFLAETSQKARDIFWPPYAEVMRRIGRERGWPPMSRAQFDASCGPKGALLVGSPQEVADKIAYQQELFGHTRFLAQMSIGPIAHADVLRSIELFATLKKPQ
ncbi:LLM class flavin-dependent oxidoreductase [Flaviaesturariibacter amylovorans]|uniref:LLM class flavin-dependent oxidoreductase n=1 Tax=Flaviaesturariibacter amylovorans TaxID=1084520 RepID=A0ABP8HAY0_9BACT